MLFCKHLSVHFCLSCSSHAVCLLLTCLSPDSTRQANAKQCRHREHKKLGQHSKTKTPGRKYESRQAGLDSQQAKSRQLQQYVLEPTKEPLGQFSETPGKGGGVRKSRVPKSYGRKGTQLRRLLQLPWRQFFSAPNTLPQWTPRPETNPINNLYFLGQVPGLDGPMD